MHLPRPVVVAMSRLVHRSVLTERCPVPLQRRLTELNAATLRPPRHTRIEHVTLGARPAERVSGARSDGAVLYLHGGGYVIGSARMYRALAGHLASASGAVVYNLDYRLAPEHTYPAALQDALAAFRELVDVHGYAPESIAIAGDSAGGGLAVATARAATDAGLRPAALVLLSPWTDPGDHDMPARDFVITRAWGTACGERYRGAADPRDPGYAPMFADLSGLPPMLIHLSEGELLNAQIKRFATRVDGAGGEVRLVELPRLWHSGHLLAGTLREATGAVSGAGAFVRARLASDVASAK
jgi:epsilon-lactone hydrolase